MFKNKIKTGFEGFFLDFWVGLVFWSFNTSLLQLQTWHLFQQSWKEKSWEGCCRDIWLRCIQTTLVQEQDSRVCQVWYRAHKLSFCDKMQVFVLTGAQKLELTLLQEKKKFKITLINVKVPFDQYSTNPGSLMLIKILTWSFHCTSRRILNSLIKTWHELSVKKWIAMGKSETNLKAVLFSNG